MTAEVAILNASAVALAADSAVTIGNRKIYNSAIKLFALSKHAPVGAMVFGNAELLGTPWETILKCYRQQLGTKSFDRLDAYLEDLELNRMVPTQGDRAVSPRDLVELVLDRFRRGLELHEGDTSEKKVKAPDRVVSDR